MLSNAARIRRRCSVDRSSRSLLGYLLGQVQRGGFLICTSLLTNSLEGCETFTHRFHHGNLLAERTAADFSAPFFLASENVCDVRIDCLAHGSLCIVRTLAT